ncbi:Ubiquinone biosynthesis protein [Phlyctochytrium bullatum]|nr:Ubiquinone biosynthesis protein [Phlyctochytrium bullatum]
MDSLRRLPKGLLGREYVDFLDRHEVTPDSRCEVKFIYDDELAYVMQRYRQVHDIFHTVTGLGISVEEELAIKWLELQQTGLPMTALSALVGPLRLNAKERNNFFEDLVPWAIQSGGRAQFFLNIHYEKIWDKPLSQVQQELGIMSKI